MSGYNEMLEKYRDVDEDEIMSGLSKDELARLENEIDREILEKPPDHEAYDSESYTTTSTSSDEDEPNQELMKQAIAEETTESISEPLKSAPRPRRSSKSIPEAFARGKLDKTQLKPVQKSLCRQKSNDKGTFKLPQLRTTSSRKSEKTLSSDEGNDTLKNELIQAVKKREGIKRRTKRGNSSGVGRRPSYCASKARRNSKIIRYRDGNEHHVDSSSVNRNFVTEELLNLRPMLKRVAVKEPKLVLPEELHGVSFNRITAGARRKQDEEEDIDEGDPDSAVSDDGNLPQNSAFGYDADNDDCCLPDEHDNRPSRRKALSESSETQSEGVATMASTASTGAESCDMFAGELSINPTSVEEMLERVVENDPTLPEVNLNNIHDVPIERFEELADAMIDNTHVTSLSLANTGITDRGAKAFADMLKKNNTLKKLNLESNFITGEGGRRLISSLRKNNCLVELSLDNQRHIFGAKAEQDMSRMLKENTSLLKLGYQFANPGLRMATSNILTKNMDIVRRKRVAEEKKKQAGQARRPQLRRQPSSEWYRKERLQRLKKIQEQTKLLGLDPAKRIGEKDVEKVLKNMSQEEVSLLERWFTSKLLGPVDKPPTAEDLKTNSPTRKPMKEAKRSTDSRIESAKKAEGSSLHPPERARRSKSPVANRDDLLASIRSSSPVRLKKVPALPVNSPKVPRNAESQVIGEKTRKDDTNSAIRRGAEQSQSSTNPHHSSGGLHGSQSETPARSSQPELRPPTRRQAEGKVMSISSPVVSPANSPANDNGSGSSTSGNRVRTDLYPAESVQAKRSPSPEAQEWKEGLEYDSDEYEVVEIEVTDSEQDSDDGSVAESKDTSATAERSCAKDKLEHLSIKISAPAILNLDDGNQSHKHGSDAALKHCQSKSGSPNPCVPVHESISTASHGPHASPRSPLLSPGHSRQSSRSPKASPSPIEKDIKPESLSTINSFFKF